jgi:Tol biopolymer transport system component
VVPSPGSTVSWSADGAWLAFAGSKGRRKGIYRLGADGTGLRFLRGTKGGRHPVVSPDGRRIAFARDRISGDLSFLASSAWVASADGRGASRLTPWRNYVEYLPSSFSPDGSVVAVTRSDLRSGSRSTVFLHRLDGRRGVRVLARRASEAVFSPDGSQIALIRHKVSSRGGIPVVVNKDLYVMGADGTASKALTRTHRIAETRPSWDPSGQRIAFNSFRISKDPIEALFDELLPVDNSIVQVNADGSCRQKLLSLRGAALYAPAWQPGPGREAGRIEC